ncbi:MAG: TetR/AcrR family transcriptional regulator [Lachnospiraceae bacterium]|nr:TetR/AcrR family transcriptional regulator [Lachnospiraceae bacterium]
MRIKDENKQQRIKDAMVSLILRDGIDGTSISKIAKEAGVSPATIYVYYESKEDMLSEVFREYATAPYRYLMQRLSCEMDGNALIDTIVRGCYEFSREHEEIFSFVEQCSRCPTLSKKVSEEESSCDILDLIHEYQARGVLRPYSDLNMTAVLFAPVRFLAVSPCSADAGEERIEELARMLQALLLY